MTTHLASFFQLFAAALVLLAAGCATTSEDQTVALLKQAGFKPLTAATFEKQQKLKSLQADRISKLKVPSGTVYYVFPLHAQNVLYAGRAPEYAAYQGLLASEKAREATLQAERRDADASWTQPAEGDEIWKDVWTAPSDF
ncbi:MAG TPA: hypothetical protein VFZ59_26050 [Verrucomicrobiae bacterium]|nr:hypothetical protein [Verrucomicrobiae bacterium]